MGVREEGRLLIGGDFNARTGEGGGPIRDVKDAEEGTGRSKDKVVNREGRTLLNELTEKGWTILNGSNGSEGRWTYIAKTGE